MWKVDEVNGGLFSDRDAHGDMLFAMGAQLHPLKELLMADYAGQADICLETIRQAVMKGPSQFRETHVVEAVTELKAAGFVDVNKRGRSYAETFVTFR
jgi:hypothetical protein